MINFINNSSEIPYIKFKEKYDEAVIANQKLIEAMSIASFSAEKNEVDSRFVNLKIIDDKEFIFFTNYNSPKSIQIKSHDQISIAIYWQSINVQIRMKSLIRKSSPEFNNKYFSERSLEKNALAISSNQSKKIDSYNSVKENYKYTLTNNDLKKCPDYWGGYTFAPYYFEFWEGHGSRLNKRDVYELLDSNWENYILEP